MYKNKAAESSRTKGLSLRVAVATLGCKVNQYESAGMAEALRLYGYQPVPFGERADIYIINTCTITQKSDYQSRQLIRRAFRYNPRAAMVVTGCYAQIAAEEISLLPGVTLVAGNVEKGNILEVVRRAAEGEKNILVSDIRRVREFSTPAAGGLSCRTRAFLKIQDGCNTFCSYCIVPHARGRSRSLPETEVLDRMLALREAGYRELVLTGINLGAYGRDLDPVTDLLTLLRRIGKQRLMPRLRLSSLEPREITKEMLSFLRENDSFCRHFHIPLQSGSDRVLSLMKRNYDRAAFVELVEEILVCLPDAAIGADVMVGFPGEGEEEFAHTRKLIETLPLAYLHVFPYSARPNTPASRLPGQVPEVEKKKRGAVIRKLGKEKRRQFAERFLGRELRVLLEDRKDRETGYLQGYSQNYIPVLVKNSRSSWVNRLVGVIAEDFRDGKIIGTIRE